MGRTRWIIGVLCLAAAGCGPGRYEPSRRAEHLARRGAELYKKGAVVASHAGGQYTDPDPTTKVREFWTNQRFAKVDSDANGHHETFFEVTPAGDLTYIGRLDGLSGRFAATGRAYRHLAGKTPQEAGLAPRKSGSTTRPLDDDDGDRN